MLKTVLIAPACAAALLFGARGALADGSAAEPDWRQQGAASFYARAHQGRPTASGAPFDAEQLTAAHAFLPFGTRVRVRLVGSGQDVVVVITDRLRSASRVIDLSLGAARRLGMVRRGVAMVELSAL